MIKQRYPEHWDMYCGVRYPIMRADIGRVAVLHNDGGLYADLDTLPNRTWYEQVDLAVARASVPKDKASAKKAARLSAKQRQAPLDCIPRPDMEVIVASAGNPLLLEWLDYMREHHTQPGRSFGILPGRDMSSTRQGHVVWTGSSNCHIMSRRCREWDSWSATSTTMWNP